MTCIGQFAEHNIINRTAKFTIEPGGMLVLLHAVFLKKRGRCNIEVSYLR
jgi:hypothetical protein